MVLNIAFFLVFISYAFLNTVFYSISLVSILYFLWNYYTLGRADCGNDFSDTLQTKYYSLSIISYPCISAYHKL